MSTSWTRIFPGMCLAVIISTLLTAQDQPPQGHMTIRLAEGSVITGRLSIELLTVDTRYGQLKVPLDQVVSFTPGLGSRPDLAARLKLMIEQLGDDQAEKRDQAQRQLSEWGEPVRPVLAQHARDSDPERSKRIELLLEELDAGLDEMAFETAEPVDHLIPEDRVVTSHFTIVGSIMPKLFSIQSRYGSLEVKLADIERAHRFGQPKPQAIKKAITVEGTHIVPGSFKNTGIRVRRGQQVTVKASGKIAMTPWGSNASSSPDGAVNYGWHVKNKIPNGTLVARIGKHDVFKVGSNIKFIAKHTGVLELGIGIHPGQAHQKYLGAYETKIYVNGP